MTRGVIEAIFVGYDAHVREIPEEDQSAKLVLLSWGGSREASPQRSSTTAFKLNSRRTESAPNKTGTIEGIGAGGSPRVGGTKALIDRRRYQLAERKIRPGFGGHRLRPVNVLSRSQRDDNRVIIQS